MVVRSLSLVRPASTASMCLARGIALAGIVGLGRVLNVDIIWSAPVAILDGRGIAFTGVVALDHVN